jgi:X-Pro dipeptidyl-peptidase
MRSNEIMRLAVPGAVLAMIVTVLAAPSPASAAAPPPPFVHGVETVPVYSYENAVRESVWVQTPTDADQDGVKDRVAVDIVRPRTAAGVKVPVIMDASPYYACCGRGNESEIKEYDANGVIVKEPLFYDNYFVPRGYAFAGVDLSGTNRSTGCEDVGGPAEVAGAKAAVDWLNGRVPGFSTQTGGTPVSARSWSTGKVGMIGKSWDGSIANGVAATGVDGLATIVPISAISSWYDYMRFNGTLRASGYPNYLQSLVSNRVEQCPAVTASLANDSADDTGDYNAYWRARDYRPAAGKVKASVFVVHGVNDLNVTTPQFAHWWADLAAQGVPRKIWLHQTGHVDPFDLRRPQWVDALHQWFDYWLQGLHNGVMQQPRAAIETTPGVWRTQSDWPAPGTRTVPVKLSPGVLGGRGSHATVSYTDDTLSESVSTANPSTPLDGRLAFLSGPLTAPLKIAGSPSLRLRVQVDQPTTQLTARLVDYGTAARVQYDVNEGVANLATQSCWGESTAADDACYIDVAENVASTDHAVITRGWQDAAHYQSLRFTTPLQPGRWYDIDVPISATDAIVPAGHVLGLILTQSDPEFDNAEDHDATVKIDLGRSALSLPVTGRATLPSITKPPTVTTAVPAPATRLTTPRKLQLP